MGLFSRNDVPNGYVRAQAAPLNAYRALTASAQRIRLDDKTELEALKKRKGDSRWQTEAWEYFDAIGEIKYSGTLIGAVLSRVRMYAAYNLTAAEAPAQVSDAAKQADVSMPDMFVNDCERIILRLQSANGGISGLLQRAGVNVWVAGECYLVQQPEKPGSGIPERWDIKSVDELDVGTDGSLRLKPTRTARAGSPLPPSAFAGRLWRSHPRFSEEADSSIRSVRDLCDEILLLSRTSRGTARSRLNAGALYLPDGLSVAQEADEEAETDPVTGDLTDVVDEEDTFEEELLEAMTTPIVDEESASAVVPLIIRGPAELGQQIKQFSFERSFDPALAKRHDTALERLMHGLDIPKNVISGLENVRYTNAVQIDETLYKAHVEPLVLLICDALTEVYFRPALRALNHPEEFVRKALLWYDPSEILTRPDRAQSANDGYDRKALSGSAWRKAHGYSDADAPSSAELIERAVIERGQFPPDMITELLKIMAPTLLAQVRQQSLADNPAGALSPQAQDILNGAPSTPPPDNGTQGGSSPNPSSAVPTPPPPPPVPTTPVPPTSAPPVPTATGLQP